MHTLCTANFSVHCKVQQTSLCHMQSKGRFTFRSSSSDWMHSLHNHHMGMQSHRGTSSAHHWTHTPCVLLSRSCCPHTHCFSRTCGQATISLQVHLEYHGLSSASKCFHRLPLLSLARDCLHAVPALMPLCSGLPLGCSSTCVPLPLFWTPRTALRVTAALC